MAWPFTIWNWLVARPVMGAVSLTWTSKAPMTVEVLLLVTNCSETPRPAGRLLIQFERTIIASTWTSFLASGGIWLGPTRLSRTYINEWVRLPGVMTRSVGPFKVLFTAP